MHKIDTSILTRFLFVDDSTKAVQTGKTVAYEIRKPDDSIFDSGNMSEIGSTGIYKHSWTPNIVGWWVFKISCASPVANHSYSYFVESGLEKDIKNYLEDATYGLSELKSLIDTIQADLDSPNQYKADVTGLALEATLTAMKGTGWSTETLKAIKDAIDGLNNLSASGVWGYGTRTLTDPNSYKANVSALALEATLSTHDSDIKTVIAALNDLADSEVWAYATRTLTDPDSYKADVSSLALEATLSTHDSDIKTLIAALNDLAASEVWGYVTRTLTDPDSYKADISALALEATLGTHDVDIKALLEHATYGLSALETLIDDIENMLKASPSVDSILFKSGGAVCPTSKSIWNALGDGTIDLNDLDAELTTIRQKATSPAWNQDTDSLEAIRAALDTHDTDIKADIGDFSSQSHLTSLLAALGIPDVSSKSLYTCLITDRLDNATYGLSALETLMDEVESMLKNATYGLSALETLIDDLEGWVAEIYKATTPVSGQIVDDVANSASTFKTTLTVATDNYFNDLQIVFINAGATNRYQVRRISAYNGTTKFITVDTAFAAEPVADEWFVIISRWTPDLAPAGEYDTQLGATERAPAGEYDTEMARITADVATESKQDTIDTNVDDIESDTSDMQPRIPRITCHMDFWSDSQAATNITAGGESGVVSLPDVVVAGLPTGITIIRVLALLKIAIIKDTSTSDNAVDVATGHVEVQKGGSGGYATAINIPDNAWAVDISEATERGGDVMIGDNDLGPSGANKVDGNATYNFEFDDIGSDGTNLQLVDVMVGLRIYFTV